MHYLAGDVNFYFVKYPFTGEVRGLNALGGHFPLASFLGERLRIVGSGPGQQPKCRSGATRPLPCGYPLITLSLIGGGGRNRTIGPRSG